MMGIVEVGAVLYAAVAIFAVVMTWREQRAKNQKSMVFNALSFALCLCWPLVVAVILHLQARRPA